MARTGRGRAFAARLRHYLAILTYPIRTGTHFNSAFALTLSHEWARQFDTDLGETIGEAALRWFEGDSDCQAWEPAGDEFLSPALGEALLMRRVMAPDRFARWFAAFLPGLDRSEPATLFAPPRVSDRSDGKIAHLDGLSLSRAWAWRELGFAQAAQRHLDAAMPHVTGDYMGEHWLASFALLALLAAPEADRDAAGERPS